VFRALFEAYPDGLLLVDAQGRILLANPAVAELLGYSNGDLIGMPVDALVPERVAAVHAMHRQGYARNPRKRPMGTDIELSARRADGSEVLVEIALSPLAGAGPGTVVASVRGVGVYPRVQRALQRAHYSEHVVQVGRLAVDTRDPKELLDRVPQVVTRAMHTDTATVWLLDGAGTALSLAAVHGGGAAEAAEPSQPNRADMPTGYVVARAAPVIVADFSRETRFTVPTELRRGGAVSALAVPLNDKGKVIGVLATRSNTARSFGAEDVAFLEALSNLLATSLQRTHTEAQLSHAQRMETVGQLTGGIAHDFNNLLTVIQGNLQMLADQPAVAGDRHCQQLVNAASRAGQRGADLTSKLLAFSRRQALAPQRVDPAALLQSLADMLRRTIGEHIRIVVSAQPDCPACRADPVQLESALLNIAINARDAMPGGGTLTFSCEAVDAASARLPAELVAELRAEPRDATPAKVPEGAPAQRWVRLAVCDTGTGMPAAVRERAFEPFFTTKEVGRGTGLGLSTVYGFVKQSGGAAHIESAPGAGSTVALFLPAIAAPGDAAPARQAAPAVGAGLRVLVVEDDADVRAVAVAFLRGMGCVVTACDHAEAALAALAPAGPESSAPAPFDLLFSDITLGSGLDGIALAARALAMRPTLRVLLTSGYSKYLTEDASTRPDTAPPWPVLRKPYTQDELTAAIATATSAPA
jgi:PAS domain S-box-containing protein